MPMWKVKEFISSQITSTYQQPNRLINFSTKANLLSVPKIVILNTMSAKDKTYDNSDI